MAINDLVSPGQALNIKTNAIRGTPRIYPSNITATTASFLNYSIGKETTPPSARNRPTHTIYNDNMIIYGGSYTDQSNNLVILGDFWQLQVIGGVWTQLSTTNGPGLRDGATIQYIGNNILILFGGYNGINVLNDMWQYDFVSGLWSLITPTNTAPTRTDYLGVMYGTQFILISGYDGTATVNDIWSYETDVGALLYGTWTPLSNVSSPGASSQLVGAVVGTILYVLSYDASTFVSYDLNGQTWATLSTTNSPTDRLGTRVVNIGTSLFFYGGLNTAVNDDFIVYDTTLDTWTPAVSNINPFQRSYCAFVILGTIGVIFGGSIDINNVIATNSTWIIDFSASPITSIELIIPGIIMRPLPRESQMTSLYGSKMLIAGGYVDLVQVYTADIWQYDYITQIWTQLPSINCPRRSDGRMEVIGNFLYIYGGYNAIDFVSGIWKYDLTARTGTQINPTTEPAYRYAFMSVAHGTQMIIWGGTNGTTPFTDMWSFETTTQTWTQISTTAPSESAGVIDGNYIYVLDSTFAFKRYDIIGNTWTTLSNTNGPSGFPTTDKISGLVLLNGYIYTFKDRNIGETGIFNVLYKYDITNNTWTYIVNDFIPKRKLGSFIVYGTNGIIFGGVIDGGIDDNEVWITDFTTATKITTGGMIEVNGPSFTHIGATFSISAPNGFVEVVISLDSTTPANGEVDISSLRITST